MQSFLCCLAFRVTSLHLSCCCSVLMRSSCVMHSLMAIAQPVVTWGHGHTVLRSNTRCCRRLLHPFQMITARFEFAEGVEVCENLGRSYDCPSPYERSCLT